MLCELQDRFFPTTPTMTDHRGAGSASCMFRFGPYALVPPQCLVFRVYHVSRWIYFMFVRARWHSISGERSCAVVLDGFLRLKPHEVSLVRRRGISSHRPGVGAVCLDSFVSLALGGCRVNTN